MNLCPLVKCGKQDAVYFKKEGNKESLEMELEPGQACAYSVKTECGSLGFLPQADNSDGLHIYTIDYEELEVDTQILPESFSTPILIPTNNSALSSEEISHQYYFTNYTTIYLRNGSYFLYNMENTGVFKVIYNKETQYYS